MPPKLRKKRSKDSEARKNEATKVKTDTMITPTGLANVVHLVIFQWLYPIFKLYVSWKSIHKITLTPTPKTQLTINFGLVEKRLARTLLLLANSSASGIVLGSVPKDKLNAHPKYWLLISVFRNAFIRVTPSHSTRFEATMEKKTTKRIMSSRFFSFGYYFYYYFNWAQTWQKFLKRFLGEKVVELMKSEKLGKKIVVKFGG